jgi:hypothetical protein
VAAALGLGPAALAGSVRADAPLVTRLERIQAATGVALIVAGRTARPGRRGGRQGMQSE